MDLWLLFRKGVLMGTVVRQIIVDSERCVACRRCEAICSLVKGKGLKSAPSRIHVASIEEKGKFYLKALHHCSVYHKLHEVRYFEKKMERNRKRTKDGRRARARQR